YDQCLTMAGRQCAEHIVALAKVLTAGGFGDSASYFWATIARQYTSHAKIHQIATDHGLDFARALDSPATQQQRVSADAHGRQLLEALVQSLRAPRLYSTSAKEPSSGGPTVSTAFTGFAFDWALGSVASSTTAAATRSPGRASTSSGCAYPQWMWPDSSALLLHAAALASLRQRQRFAHEERVYLSGTADDLHTVCATPGVANTYASVWLVPQRKALGSDADDDACARLLTSALRSLAPADSERSLVQVVRDGSHMSLLLASQLAETYAGRGKHAQALEVFALLADRFRTEGWGLLTGHALQWVVRCCRGTSTQPTVSDSSSSEVRALLELLSPHVVASVQERTRIGEDLVGRLAQTAELLGTDEPSQQADCGPVELKIDMSRIYSPLTCHAHWRHWRPSADATHMAFQVSIDCRSLAVALALDEVAIRIACGNTVVDVRVANGTGAGASGERVCADGLRVRYHDIGVVGGAAATVAGLRVDLQGITVLEGRVSLKDNLQAVAVVLDSVSLYVAGGGDWRLRLFWPTCARPSSATAHPSTVSQSIRLDDDDAAAALNQIERLLLCNIGIARMQGKGRNEALLGPSGQLALSAAMALGTTDEDQALRKAIAIAGPAASLPGPLARKWLHAGRRWVQLPMPPLVPDKQAGCASQPTVSAYSRCRVLRLPDPEPALSISMDCAGPALQGEAFPVHIVVTNMHPLRTVARIDVSASLEPATLAAARGSMSDLDVAGGAASPLSGIVARQTAADPVPAGSSSGLAWLSNDQGQSEGRNSRPQTISVAVGSSGLAPGESLRSTVYVHIPAAMLSSASPGTAAQEKDEGASVSLALTARHVFSDDSSSGQTTAQTTAQTTVPVVRHLFAQAEALALPAPQSSDGASPLMQQPIPASVPATDAPVGDGGEFCFRRPVLVTLVNRGPFDITVEQMRLRPPLPDPRMPMHVQLAGNSAQTPETVEAGGGILKHVFWLDIRTRDVVRVASSVNPGTLEILWRRQQQTGAAVIARLWLPPLALVRRHVQVDMVGAAVARVGQPMTVCYRVLNATRAVQTVATAMHASDAFVFAGLRRTTLRVLPGHVGLLRFNLVPTTASQRPVVDPTAVEYAPGHAALAMAAKTQGARRRGVPAGVAGNVAGLGWTLLPRLDVHIAEPEGENGTPPPPRPHGLFSPVVSSPPPPPASRVTLASEQESAVRQRAQQAIIALAGLEKPDQEGLGLLSPGLSRGCVDMVPDYFVQTSDAAGAESDVDSDEPVVGDLLTEEDTVVLRYDQTAVFCAPN
ncbi:hypothetical protein EV175_003099, partial [Coemansia sp. RSA 1933]